MVDDRDKNQEEVRKVIFNRYELGRLLGHGTFAKVYHARDLNSGESLAVKVISKDVIRREPAMSDQIRREISVMRLVGHPNVIELHEVLATRSRIFFVMEYARGGELFSKITRGRLPEPAARRYFRQLISAVDFCHSRGIYHRDLKPENLLLDEENNLKVSDFGLSALPEQLRHDGLLHTQCGTPAYVAPEVLRKKGYDGSAADIWSCGVILFGLLAGFLPFQDDNLMKMYTKIFKAEYITPPWFSPDARRLISRVLVVDPKKRITIPAMQKLPWFQQGDIPPPSRSISAPPQLDREEEVTTSPRFYNAFELIAAISTGFDLSGLFESGRITVGVTVFTSKMAAAAVLAAVEKVGKDRGLRMEKLKEGCGVKMERKAEGRNGRLAVTVEVFEAAPEVAVVELRKDSGDTLEYAKFCDEYMRPRLEEIVWTWQGDSRAADVAAVAGGE